VPPFTILHVCIGNICRSPMAERLLVAALRESVGDRTAQLYLSHGAGTGTWHVGEQMNPPAARQVRLRGGDPSGFRARTLRTDMIDSADLILCATGVQSRHVTSIRPDAAPRTFVLGEFGRLLAQVDRDRLPRNDGRPPGAYARGVALVERVDAARAGLPPSPGDDLDDPWGGTDRQFARVADEIDATVRPLAATLAGAPRPGSARSPGSG
jgi:protein-tyrosine phosphatase